jgi:hypothetical protein
MAVNVLNIDWEKSDSALKLKKISFSITISFDKSFIVVNMGTHIF